MIAAGMGYAIAVSLLLGLAALAIERWFAQFRWPRRGVWILALAASLAIPCAALLEAREYSDAPANLIQVQTAGNISDKPETRQVMPEVAARPSLLAAYAWPALPQLDSLLLGFWVLASSAAVAIFSGAWLRFRRIARMWPRETIDGKTVLLSEKTGPAVFGVFRPRIILPRRLLDAPLQTRSLVMQHEQAHIAALDPLLLMAALLMVLLVPWNLPLWWQLRRLRFAIEVDCDARVLRQGTDPVIYGEALLAVGQHGSDMPLGAVALTEPASQLERRIRIMMFTKPRHQALLSGAFLALATIAVACAAQLDAPQAEQTPQLRKLPPRLRESWIIERLQGLVQEKYPQVWQGKVEGDPSVIFLFKSDGAVDRTSLEKLAEGDTSYVPFERLGLKSEELGYVSALNIPSSTTGKKISVIYAERRRPDNVYKYTRPAYNAAVDRAILAQYFPALFRGDESPSGQLWVLLDSAGQVLRSGQEAVRGDSSRVAQAVMARFPGIEIDPISTSQAFDQNLRFMTDRNGDVVGLFSLWLKPGSALPRDAEPARTP